MTAALRTALRLALNRERRAKLGLVGNAHHRDQLGESMPDWSHPFTSELPVDKLLEKPWDPDAELRLLFPVSPQYGQRRI